MELEIVRVCVKVRLCHLDRPHPGFDQPPCDQAGPSELRISIGGHALLRFLLDLERRQLLRCHHPLGFADCVLVESTPSQHPPSVGERPLDHLEVLVATLHPRLFDRGQHVLKRLARVEHLEGVVLSPRYPPPPRPLPVTQRNVQWNLDSLVGKLMREDRPSDGWIVVGSGRNPVLSRYAPRS